MSKRKFNPPPVEHVPLMTDNEVAAIRMEAEAEGEEFVVALCDVARDPLAPLTARKCMELLQEFAKEEE